MGEAHSFETVDRAEELYCVEGHTFESVAALTGVAQSTLKRWSEQYGWQEKKQKIRQALSSIRANTIRLRAKLIENCLETLNAQDAFAVSSLESLALKAADLSARGQALSSPVPEATREIKTDADAVKALEDAVQLKLNTMLAQPGAVSLTSVKEVKQVLDLLKTMKADGSQEAEGTAPKVLDAEQIKRIREQIL